MTATFTRGDRVITPDRREGIVLSVSAPYGRRTEPQIIVRGESGQARAFAASELRYAGGSPNDEPTAEDYARPNDTEVESIQAVLL